MDKNPARRFKRDTKTEEPTKTARPKKGLGVDIETFRKALFALADRVKELENSGGNKKEYVSEKSIHARRIIDSYESEIDDLTSHSDRDYAEERTKVLERRIDRLRQEIE